MATSVDFLDYNGLKEFDAQNKINYRKAIENEAVKITASIGNIGLLTTDNKENLVNAVNELHNKISNNGGSSSSGSLVIEEQDEEGYYKVYSFKQNNNEIGKIKLFNNEILQSGFVYKKGGKIYLKLVYLINGVTEKEVLIDVSSIAGSGTSSPGGGSSESGGVNFTPEENATEIQLILENGILSATLVNESITSEKIGYGAVNTGNIKDGSITNAKIKAGSLEASAIKDKAIIGDKIANDTITNANLKDQTIESVKLANDAIENRTLKNGSITSDKIADNNIGGEKIIDKSITASKIADETLTLSQCSPELASMIKSAATPISGKMFFITADEYKALEQSGNIQEEALYFITTEV